MITEENKGPPERPWPLSGDSQKDPGEAGVGVSAIGARMAKRQSPVSTEPGSSSVKQTAFDHVWTHQHAVGNKATFGMLPSPSTEVGIPSPVRAMRVTKV